MANIAVEGAQKTALLQASDTGNQNDYPILLRVAKVHHVSPLRQMREMLALSIGWQRIRPKEYYTFGLFDPAMPMKEKRQYVGRKGSSALNARLSPPELTPSRAFIANNVLYSAMLRQLGLGAADTQAVVSAQDGFGTLLVLADEKALKQFLTAEASFPVFGKRCRGSGATGVVRIKAVSGDAVVFGNGSRQPLDAFCSAILNKHPDGYLLQSALNPHPVCAEVTGEHTGCVRIVTVHDGGTPRPVYALWKIPAPESATDNAHQSGAMLAKIDLSNGKILACRTGTGLEVREITHHPVSGAQIVGRTLPHWDDVTSLAENAHALFPEFGLFGFDIAICADGPKIVDCSETPCHQLYQLATGRGISNRDLAPVWEKVVSWQKAQSARNMSHIGRERCIEA